MTKKEAYLKLAKTYCKSNKLEFICNDLQRLFKKPENWLNDLDTLLTKFPEICLFSIDEDIHAGMAWMCDDTEDDITCTRIKALVMLFCIEILNDEKKIQKKSKVRNIR